MYINWCNHKRRIYTLTEEKTKVVAAVWGTEFIRILAALAILHQNERDELHQDVMKKRMNSSSYSNRPGAEYLVLHGRK